MMPIYTDRPQAEKYWKIQKISRKQKGGGNYGQENQRHDNQQSIDRNGQEVTKMVQSIQISPEIEWGLSTGSRHVGSKSVYETNSFQNGRYTNSRTTPDEERLCDLLQSQGSIQPCSSTSHNAGFTGNTISGSIIQVSRDVFRPKRCTKGINSNNEKKQFIPSEKYGEFGA
jgi:hypothetical protein